MAKKSKKIVSNRGFATVSAPSKKTIPEKNVNQPEPEPEPEQQKREEPPKTEPPESLDPQPHHDPTNQLIDSNLNERKALRILDRISVADQEPFEQNFGFGIPATIEHELLKTSQRDKATFGRCGSHPNDAKMIGQLDVLYRVLQKLSFDVTDIERSFEATFALTIEEHLDWLCVNVPYERMPLGFFDKYFNEQDTAISVGYRKTKESSDSTKSTESTESIRQVESNPEHVTKPKQNPKAALDNDYRARILEAAQKAWEKEQSINEKYATLMVELSSLEKQIPDKKSKKKKGNNKRSSDEQQQELSEYEIQNIKRKISNIQQSLKHLETDWEFDKQKANELFIDHMKKAHKPNEPTVEPTSVPESTKDLDKETSLKDDNSKNINDDHNDNDDDYDDDTMFGGMMEDMENMENASPGPSAVTTSVKWEILDLSCPKWKGKMPKDLLHDYEKKLSFGKQSYSSKTEGAGLWRSTVTISPKKSSGETTKFELPPGLGASNKQEAEQLVATAALFKLDPEASIFQVMPLPYKDRWLVWKEEKRLEEEKPKFEAAKKRLDFLTNLLDQSQNNKDIISNGPVGSEEKIDKSISDNYTPKDTSPKRRVFSKVQHSFEKRLKTNAYANMKRKRSELPIAAYREDILQLVQDNQVIIISGETGCGKSTQVPQFLAESLLQDFTRFGSVVCTQPRRISAMSIAHRVSVEMGDRPRATGTPEAMVGYQIRLESKVSPENVLVFCTTGILLRRLESDKNLEGVTHVIVDEVHERTIESDFLLIILRRLCHARPDLRVILMSATVEANRFSSYFGHCPVVSVPGRTFPVHVRYLEDVIESTGYVLEADSHYALRSTRVRQDQGSVAVSGKHGNSQRVRIEWYEDSDDDDPYDPTRVESKLNVISNPNEIEDGTETENEGAGAEGDRLGQPKIKYSKQTAKMMRRMDESKINYDIMVELLEYICIESHANSNSEVPSTGAILVFLPGMPEIRKVYDLVSSHSQLGDPQKFLLIALHSALSSEHQERAFDIPPDGIRKIVLSTNIAETGVTISDVTVVVDTGMAKVVSYDEKKKITRLRQTFVAKANARQRRGRAGRVQEGICFHMFSQHRYELMANYETPEILRLPLEELCLRIKVCGLGSIRDVLDSALDAPSKTMIDNAVQTLQDVQALSVDGVETLTPLGVHLSNLPVDVHVGKMILFGAIFQCLDPVLTIAASLSFKSPFVRPFGKESEADTARMRFQHADSDFWTIYMAYKAWRAKLLQVQGKPGWIRQMREFCSTHFLSQQNLEMIEDMKRQYLGLLISIGFVDPKKTSSNPLDESTGSDFDLKKSFKLCQIPAAYNTYADSIPVVNAAIVAGLYPKVAARARDTGLFMTDKLGMHTHPSSTLFGREKQLKSEFLVYNTIVMSNDKVYLWEASSVDSVAIMLFATRMEIKHKLRQVVLDNWIYFKCFARSAVLIKFLRNELNNLLTAKMDHPEIDLTDIDRDIMSVMVKTLETRV
ncbi:P-loop containing nucleoside triphosphate hydrolase protein [Phycomyces blakesleeanus]